MAGVASPCIGVCSLNGGSGLCEGCFRSSEEIANWLYYSDDKKHAVIGKLDERKRKAADKGNR